MREQLQRLTTILLNRLVNDLNKPIARRILIAEDNLINQKVAARLLGLLGYSADIAENGEEAVRLAETGNYDAVLMDMQMPVMDGLDATRAIRALESPVSNTPIIAVTANPFEDARQKCLAAGMNDFISKPIEPALFASVLAYWTDFRFAQDKLTA
jgi:CheY-like chemotaxis protein